MLSVDSGASSSTASTPCSLPPTPATPATNSPSTPPSIESVPASTARDLQPDPIAEEEEPVAPQPEETFPIDRKAHENCQKMINYVKNTVIPSKFPKEELEKLTKHNLGIFISTATQMGLEVKEGASMFDVAFAIFMEDFGKIQPGNGEVSYKQNEPRTPVQWITLHKRLSSISVHTAPF